MGLVKQYNPLNIAPGALVTANNCVIRREDIIENRRGYKSYGTVSNNVTQLFAYNNTVLAHNSTTLSYDNGSGTFSGYTGTYTAPSGVKSRGIEAYSNFYLTTAEGIKVFTDTSGTQAKLAGAPRALDPSYSLTSINTGFLTNNYQCAYRCLIKRTDANNNVKFGYPSQRLWATNASGNDENVTLTVYLPSECVSGDEIQFYRTEIASGTSSDTAGEEMGKVYEQTLSASDISAGYIFFTDSVTDELRGAKLYTSPSQEGIAQANAIPPLAKDVALYKSNYMFYANTETKQRLSFTVVGTSKLGQSQSGDTHTNTTLDGLTDTSELEAGMQVEGSGIPAGTTIASVDSATAVTLSQAATATATVTITFITHRTLALGGQTYSFKSSETAASAEVGVSVTGVVANDIDLTARSLVRVINRYASNTAVYAYYLSGPDDLPGQILLEEKGLGASAFTVQVSNAQISGQFFPEAPASPATESSMTSSNDERGNALYYSKYQQPEAVPLLNYLPAGPTNKDILRIAPLRDSLIIIKEEGVYRLTGENPQGFVVTPLDLTVVCKSADSVCILSNQVFMLSNQGIVSITENGVQVVSREIEPLLLPLLQDTALSSKTYAFSYESERSYIISTISNNGDASQNQTFVFNVFTRTWVRWTFAIEAGIVEPNADKYYFCKPSDTDIYVERKSFTDDDFADPETTITISSISGATVDFTISTGTPEIGWSIKQGTTAIPITSLITNAGSYTATLEETPPGSWATGSATIFPSVKTEIEWQPWTGNQAGALKQVRALGYLADDLSGYNTVQTLIATVRTNFDNELQEITLTQPGGGWGDSWGEFPWGGEGDSYGYPTWVPQNMQYCVRMYAGFKHNNAFERFSCAGVVYEYEMLSEGIGR